jgi:hypothetical protein
MFDNVHSGKFSQVIVKYILPPEKHRRLPSDFLLSDGNIRTRDCGGAANGFT